MSDDRIIVVGGGIGGFAAALALAQKGYPVHLLEQSPEFKEFGAGIQIGPNVFKMFEVLGLIDAINETAVFPEALVMKDAITGNDITRIPINSEVFRARFKYPYGVIYRKDLHEVLIDACKALPLIELSVNQKVTHFEDTGDKVRVFTEAGQIHEGIALIGADGLWSKIRECLLGDKKPIVSGHVAYRAVLPTSEVPEHLQLNQVVLWAGPKTHLVHYPLHRSEITNLVAVFHSDRYEQGWDVFGDTEELNTKFKGEHPDVMTLLGKIESWRMWVLCDREPMRDWAKGRVVLLGDAAHPMLQYLAQGACMAIEDGVCLAHKLSLAKENYQAAFLSYQQARYLRTTRVQHTARFYGQVYHAEGATADLRNCLLANRDPAKAYDGMAWLYQGVGDHGEQLFD